MRLVTFTGGIFKGHYFASAVSDRALLTSNYTYLYDYNLVKNNSTRIVLESQYGDEITKNLKSVPHFLDEVLVQNLQAFTGLGSKTLRNGSIAGLWNVLDTFKFRKYITVTKNNLAEGLEKISEITADALFNLPAFLTADLWSKSGAPAFLYRFEHSGRAKKAHYFLQGLPIIGNHSTFDEGDAVGHGDDLAYLFEAHALDGTPIPGVEDDFTEADIKVRNIFTEMISTFARHGKINVENKAVPSFSSETNQYMQISAQPKLVNNFRFCQMALWAGLTDRLQKPACKLLNVLDTQLRNVEFMLFDTVQSAGSQTGLGKPLTDLTGAAQNAGETLGSVLTNPGSILNIGGHDDKNSKNNKNEGQGRGGLLGLGIG